MPSVWGESSTLSLPQMVEETKRILDQVENGSNVKVADSTQAQPPMDLRGGPIVMPPPPVIQTGDG